LAADAANAIAQSYLEHTLHNIPESAVRQRFRPRSWKSRSKELRAKMERSSQGAWSDSSAS